MQPKRPTIALLLVACDHVGVVLDDVRKGDIVELRDMQGTSHGSTIARSDIPFGHKIARTLLKKGAQLLRYGQPIGVATADIVAGDHVHTHNLVSTLSIHPVIESEQISRSLQVGDGRSETPTFSAPKLGLAQERSTRPTRNQYGGMNVARARSHDVRRSRGISQDRSRNSGFSIGLDRIPMARWERILSRRA
jgi:hypothetical protein